MKKFFYLVLGLFSAMEAESMEGKSTDRFPDLDKGSSSKGQTVLREESTQRVVRPVSKTYDEENGRYYYKNIEEERTMQFYVK